MSIELNNNTINNNEIETQQCLVNKGRPMMSRSSSSNIKILNSLRPGVTTPSCLACCAAPACCPILALCPCCTDAEYVSQQRQASAYILLREHSLEWNAPRVVLRRGMCFGLDPCVYQVQDHVTVLYYDDVMFDRITDQTRCCNEFRTCICGGIN